jgi:hypothetical protein
MIRMENFAQKTNRLDFIEQTLTQKTWFTGEQLTGADIQMSFPLLAASTRTDLTSYPTNAFLNKRRPDQLTKKHKKKVESIVHCELYTSDILIENVHHLGESSSPQPCLGGVA